MINYIFTEHLDTIITAGITIVGFIITIVVTKNSFKNEIAKEKISHNIEAIQTLPYEICELLTEMQDGKIDLEKYKVLTSKIVAYGSKEATNIMVYTQRTCYNNNDEINWSLMAGLSILVSQLKYDFSSVIISPENWFKLKVTDYDENMECIMKEEINKIVAELNLSKKFKV